MKKEQPKDGMAEPLPLLPVDQEQLAMLIAAMLAYRLYVFKKMPSTAGRAYTLMTLALLIPKLQCGMGVHEEAMPLLLTQDDVLVMKTGLAVLLERLGKKAPGAVIKREMQRLKALKTMLEQTFRTTQD